MLNKKDKEIIRELATRVAEIAALPVQAEKRTLWRKLNARKPVRPMVLIDQVCWNEMAIDDELTLRCTDSVCRRYELNLRLILYQWTHFPVDMVVEPIMKVAKAVHNSGLGIRVREEIAVGDPTNAVVGHKYENQFRTEEDLEKIRVPKIGHDKQATDRRLETAHELFDGLLTVQPAGVEPYLSLWDPISTWMGVQNALYALIDTPDYIHRLLSRLTDSYMSMLDQLAEQGLLCGPQNLIHCTGAYTDELPAAGYDPERPRTKDLWMFGLAQMFSSVSPAMFKEFEVDYTSRIAARFGLVYYGCCDPLDRMMPEVRMIPNVRKVSMSAWVNEERGAAEIGREFVYSRKPSPALLAGSTFDPESIRKDLEATRKVCEANDCPLEFILKDISTVGYQPARLFQWADIAMETVGG